MSNESYIPLILGKPFLATARAVVDLPNKRIAFSHIDENVFYNAAPDFDGVQHSSCVSIDGARKLVLKPKIALRRKNEVNEVLDRDTHFYARKSTQVGKKDRPKSEVISSRSHVTLAPLKCVGDTIEYKLKYNGKSRPFSKIKAIVTPEFKEKGQAVLDDMLTKVLEIDILDDGAGRHQFKSPPPHPGPRQGPHHI
ncbi:hypothetical protein V5N11_026134 [Cardamine amara subsp. amara]|uniref:Uncharacterized protein n=1 Tax=Cardamine amara subsp. amara TaxID=228776 RepID=A0ABD1BGX4_CARAN